MAKTAKTETTIHDIIMPEATNAKAVAAFIRGAIQSFTTGRKKMHAAACFAIRACVGETVFPQYLTMIYDGLKTGSSSEETDLQASFRQWVAATSAYLQKDVEGNVVQPEVKKNWIGWNAKDEGKKKRGFYVKKDTMAYREATPETRTLLDGRAFFDRNTGGNNAAEYTFEKVLAWLGTLEKGLTTRLERLEGVELPEGFDNVVSDLKDITSRVTALMPPASNTVN